MSEKLENSYSYVLIAKPHALFRCERILEGRRCFFKRFEPLNRDDNAGKYVFDEPLEGKVLQELKESGCEIYQQI